MALLLAFLLLPLTYSSFGYLLPPLVTSPSFGFLLLPLAYLRLFFRLLYFRLWFTSFFFRLLPPLVYLALPSASLLPPLVCTLLLSAFYFRLWLRLFFRLSISASGLLPSSFGFSATSGLLGSSFGFSTSVSGLLGSSFPAIQFFYNILNYFTTKPYAKPIIIRSIKGKLIFFSPGVLRLVPCSSLIVPPSLFSVISSSVLSSTRNRNCYFLIHQSIF